MGIDIWNQADLSGNTFEAAMRNAAIEGVADKIAIPYADAQSLPFADSSFDYIFSNLCLHDIATNPGREAACKEIAKVLKPTGTAIISDFMYTAAYQKRLTGSSFILFSSGSPAFKYR